MKRLLIAVFALCLCASGQEPGWQDAWKQRLQEIQNQVVTVRGFYAGKKLQYSAEGVVQDPKLGSWEHDAFIKIKRIEFRPDMLVLTADRLDTVWDKDGIKATRESHGNVTIELSLEPDGKGFGDALRKVLLSRDEKIQDFLPGNCAGNRIAPGSLSNTALKVIGPHMTPPHAKHAPNPDYTQIARMEKIQGTVILWAVVGADGKPEKVCVVRPIGWGLDQRAVEAVQQWRFDPAKRDGVPVAVQINVEVNFKLY